nr:pentatricopeptide repeat-containing protein At2g13600-like [Ipomoea batatas]
MLQSAGAITIFCELGESATPFVTFNGSFHLVEPSISDVSKPKMLFQFHVEWPERMLCFLKQILTANYFFYQNSTLLAEFLGSCIHQYPDHHWAASSMPKCLQTWFSIPAWTKSLDVFVGNALNRYVYEVRGLPKMGQAIEALEIFKDMLIAGEKPDHVTMIGVLCACSHAGLVEEGRQYFYSMREYDLEPLKDHYTCMVDILGRAGCLDEARNLIESMPIPPDGVVWGSLLSACKTHGDMELGKHVAEKLLEVDPENSGPYVLLSNMYAELGRWKDVAGVRKLMRQDSPVAAPGVVKDSRPERRKIFCCS